MNRSKHLINAHIRKAQAAEIFRNSFSKYALSDVRISLSDIDELVRERFVRPSVLLNFYGFIGSTSGMAARLASRVAGPAAMAEIEKIVDEATLLQFNDSMREIQSFPEKYSDEEIKETLKFHRDLRLSTDQGKSDSSFKSVSAAISGGFYQALKISFLV